MKKILVVVLYDYYLFEYFLNVVEVLLQRGHQVTLVYSDPKLKMKYEGTFGSRIRYLRVPKVISVANNLSKRFYARLTLWILGMAWVKSLGNKYDFVLTPWDNKPLWHIFCSNFPSLANDVVTNFIDIDLRLEAERFKGEQRPIHRVMNVLDRISGERFLPRLKGVVTKYNPSNLLVDRLMATSRVNFLSNFGNSTFLTVTGHKIKANLVCLGVSPEKIIVTGHPGYDHLIAFAQSHSSQEDRQKLRSELDLPGKSIILTMFLSPSSFNEKQLQEIELVFNQVAKNLPDQLVIIKFHPKTNKGQHEKVTALAQRHGLDYREIRQFFGDLHNLKLMLASDFLLQKQCTLGFLAMNANTPMISYNLIPGDYEDDMYQKMGASKHATGPEELGQLLRSMLQGPYRQGIIEGYVNMRDNYCLHTTQASETIAKTIEKSPSQRHP